MAPIGKKSLARQEELPVGNKLPVDPLAPRLPLPQNKAKPDDLVVKSDLSSLSGLPAKTKLDGGHVADDDCMILDGDLNKAVPAKLDGGHVADDDCVILDGNPNKAVSVAKMVGSVGDSSSDELQITDEKGELACRDFPHPRNLCFTHPFSATSHEKYCHMCHCFVCDTPAPCKYWGGDGASIIGHCHATDKEPMWKNLRQTFKVMFQFLNSDGTLAAKSGPEIHQNAIHSTVTAPSQQVEAMQGHVSVPQPPSSSIPNRGRTFRAYRNHVLKQWSQNQQRHPSNMRLSMSVAGTSTASQIQNSQANQQYIAPQHTCFSLRNYVSQLALRMRNGEEVENISTPASAPQKNLTDVALGHIHTDKPREVFNRKALRNKLHSAQAEASNQSQQTNPTSPSLTEDYNLQESTADRGKRATNALPAKNLIRRSLRINEKNKNHKAQIPADKARLAKGARRS